MLLHIQPNRKKSKEGGLTKQELPLVKELLKAGYSSQDIVHIVNQGRATTINLARVTEAKSNTKVAAAPDADVRQFLRVQSSYDPRTLLNPYKDERLIRARESMMAAVQVFNNPTILFKTEMFCVLANIAWTYLMHEKMERTEAGSSKLGNGKSVTVSGTLDKTSCPIKSDIVRENLKKIIEIRDAVEHTFFVGGEECFGALFQANCINFESHMTEWFGEHLSLAKDLSLALQFVKLKKDQVSAVEESNLPAKIKAINASIQASPFADSDIFQLNVYYTTEVSSKTNADMHKLVTYEQSDTATQVAIKKLSYTKLSQGDLVSKVKAKGYKKFSDWEHQQFWKSKWPNQAKRNSEASAYGEIVLKNQWQWYEQTWLPIVLQYCEESGAKFK